MFLVFGSLDLFILKTKYNKWLVSQTKEKKEEKRKRGKEERKNPIFHFASIVSQE